MTLAAPAAAATAPVTTAAAAADDSFGEIIVTAERRSENLQKVPVAIVALGTEKLAQLQVQSFNDYARFLPSVSFDTSQAGGANVYFRGVASGGDGNHSGPLPSVGIYLDDQPITTIGGALDLHIYDIARVEALAGPQGTLYGASSQAGTIRIISNKPEFGKTSGGYDLQVNHITKGGTGGIAEGFINLPVGDRAALRLVGWYDREAGFIDNLPGKRTFPISGFSLSNIGTTAKKNYNTIDTAGGRAALRWEISDALTVTPTIMGQSQISHGFFSRDPSLGDLAVMHYAPERGKDDWVQAALTIEGKISNFDLTYTGAYLERKIDATTDYSDYTVYYDYLSHYIVDNAGKPINPAQNIVGHDKFSKLSQEFRITSPAENRLRLIAGLFYQRQTHDIEQIYTIDGLATRPTFDSDGNANAVAVSGRPGVWWLTKQYRIDRDYAAFGQLAFDILPNLTLTGGGRLYKFDNSLIGFFGYGKNNPAGSSGENICFGPATTSGAPCTDLGVIGSDGKIHPKTSKGNGFIHKLNLSWQATPDALLYATWSRGFRPGGINRRGTLPPYTADFLTNYEIGFKGAFFDRKVRLNAAIFDEEWKNFQLAFLGQNSLTVVQNAGNARIKGVEGELSLYPAEGLVITASGTYTDAHLTTNYCKITDNANAACTIPAKNFVRAPAGQALPVTPDFKGNIVARYDFPIRDWKAHVQGAAAHVGSRWAALPTDDRSTLGKLPAYTTADFSFGVARNGMTIEAFVENAFDSRGNLSRFAECTTGSCGPITTYQFVTKPREIGLKFGQRF